MTIVDPQPSPDQLVELLRWYGEMGVDVVVDEVPHDRFAEARLTAPPPPPSPIVNAPPEVVAEAPPPLPSGTGRRPLPGRAPAQPMALPLDAAALSAEVAVSSAREAAAGAATLDALRDALDRFEGCALKRSASRLVFADGNPLAKLMIVGEAPGAEEDRSGLPFVGKGGQLLDRMLASIGLDRTHVYIANVVPWRPPGNRTPTPQEIATCLPFIRRQIALADPDRLLLVGAAAMQALLPPTKEGITRARGRWVDYDLGSRIIPAMPMLHPAYLLRTPTAKRDAWRDLRTLATALHLSPVP